MFYTELYNNLPEHTSVPDVIIMADRTLEEIVELKKQIYELERDFIQNKVRVMNYLYDHWNMKEINEADGIASEKLKNDYPDFYEDLFEIISL